MLFIPSVRGCSGCPHSFGITSLINITIRSIVSDERFRVIEKKIFRLKNLKEGTNMRNKSALRKLFLQGMALCLAVSILAFVYPEGTTAQTTTTKKTTPKYGGILKRCYDNDAQQLGNPTARPFDLTSVKLSRPAIETLLRYDEKLFSCHGLPKTIKSVMTFVQSHLPCKRELSSTMDQTA